MSLKRREHIDDMGICAYGRARDWKRALSLLEEMRKRSVSPNVIDFNAAISVFETGFAYMRRYKCILFQLRVRLSPWKKETKGKQLSYFEKKNHYFDIISYMNSASTHY